MAGAHLTGPACSPGPHRAPSARRRRRWRRRRWHSRWPRSRCSPARAWRTATAASACATTAGRCWCRPAPRSRCRSPSTSSTDDLGPPAAAWPGRRGAGGVLHLPQQPPGGHRGGAVPPGPCATWRRPGTPPTRPWGYATPATARRASAGRFDNDRNEVGFDDARNAASGDEVGLARGVWFRVPRRRHGPAPRVRGVRCRARRRRARCMCRSSALSRCSRMRSATPSASATATPRVT